MPVPNSAAIPRQDPKETPCIPAGTLVGFAYFYRSMSVRDCTWIYSLCNGNRLYAVCPVPGTALHLRVPRRQLLAWPLAVSVLKQTILTMLNPLPIYFFAENKSSSASLSNFTIDEQFTWVQTFFPGKILGSKWQAAHVAGFLLCWERDYVLLRERRSIPHIDIAWQILCPPHLCRAEGRKEPYICLLQKRSFACQGRYTSSSCLDSNRSLSS